MSLKAEELELIVGANEVVIETRSGGRVFKTVIWVAIDGQDVFVRSVRGGAGRWLQRALSEPEVTLGVGDTKFRFTAILVTDAGSVERASEGFRRKYRQGRSLDAMLRPEVLDTTLLLEPLV